MVRKQTIVLAGIASYVLTLLPRGLDALVDRLVADEWGWVPQLESLGQTVMVYVYLGNFLQFAVGIAFVAGLGYWAGRRLDLAQEYRDLLVSLGGGGALGHALALLTVFSIRLSSGVAPGSVPSVFDWILFGGVLLVALLSVGIKFALVGFAGAAIGHFSGSTTGKNGSETTASNGALTPEPIE